MNAAEIVLALLQTARLILELLEKYGRGQLTDEQLVEAWVSMQKRLGDVSLKIRT